MKFRTIVLQGGKTVTGIAVPTGVVEALAAGRRPAVRVTLNGYTYRSTIASRGGEFLIPVSAEVRERAGVAAGDEVQVDLQLDTEPRQVAVPDDLTEALGVDAEAAKTFEGLPYSHQRSYTDWIESAKRPETRERRIQQAVEMLRSGRRSR